VDHITRVLQDLSGGGYPDIDDVEAAWVEVRAMRLPAKVSPNQIVTVQDCSMGDHDQTLRLLGETFTILHNFVAEMKKKGAITMLSGPVGESMLDTKQHLLAHHYEPATLKRFDNIQFKPVPQPPQSP
jgi:hypothetical protein